MKLRMLTFLSLAMTSLAFALTPNGKTTLVNETTYKADDEGATYEITTNGADVNAVIDVTANVTIVMNNCHIVADSLLSGRPAPIQISTNKTLELLFKGENKIVANRNVTTYQYGAIALSSDDASTGGVIFAEAEKDASLYLRGTSREAGTRAPIDFYQRGFVLFRSGHVTIASSPRTYGSTELIPSLAKAETISLRGGTLIAQMTSPFLADELAKTDLIGSKLLNVENTVCPLFTCVNFVMTGGMITTNGDKACPTGDDRLIAASKPYDTAYAYAQQHMENLTSETTSVSITGGVRRDPTAAYFRGFAAESGSIIPQACFSKTVNIRKVNDEGVVKITGSYAQVIDLLYVDEKAKAKVEVLNTPLRPTDTGVNTTVDLGISKILPLIATNECQLELALKIPDDKTLLQKTICVQILATNDAQEVSVVFDGDVTFTRETTETPYFTVSVTCPDNATTGTLRYSVRAYN